MTSLADAERVVVERIENHSSRQVEEFALDTSDKDGCQGRRPIAGLSAFAEV